MILGIDPGESTGVAVISYSEDTGNFSLVESHTFGEGITRDGGVNFRVIISKIESLIEEYEDQLFPISAICVEDYDDRVYGGSYPAKIVGAVWAAGLIYDLPVISPYPTRTKMVSDKLLKSLIEIGHLGIHERDAVRVVVSCMKEIREINEA